MKKNSFEQILRPLLSEGKSFGKENEKGIVIPWEETTCATNFGRSSVHPITSREKKKTLPNTTRSVQDDVFCRERHSSRAVSLPTCSSCLHKAEQNPSASRYSCSCTQGRATAQGSHIRWNPRSRSARQDAASTKATWKETVRPQGWSVCLHSPFPQI